MQVENLKLIAETLPTDAKQNALALLEEMGSVIEGIGDNAVEWKPPFLRLVQGTTDRSTIPKGTAIGDFVLGEKKVDNPLEFIPLRMWDARQYWDPDQNNKKMLCNSPDAKLGYIGIECKLCPKSKWVEGVGSECNKIKGMLAITADLRQLFSINFAKTSYKPGMELEGLMRKAGVSPYRRTYGLATTSSTTAKNVEMFKIEILPENKRITADTSLEFLKGLFDIIGADRKSAIDRFYEAARQRTDTISIAPPDTTLVIENKPSETQAESTTLKETSVSPLAKNYKV